MEKYLNQIPFTILSTYIFYDDVSEHQEFIVRYYDDIALGNKNATKELMKPLKDFVKTYINPILEEYITNHPNKHLLSNNNLELGTQEHNITPDHNFENEVDVSGDVKDIDLQENP